MSKRRIELNPSLLMNAYSAGVFPMAESADDPDIYWVDPAIRGICPLNGFHAPRSLLKRIRRADHLVTLNRAFHDVLDGCADRDETWINAKIRELYGALHEFGYCHSVEVWMDGELAGGLYGVSLGGAFFGESMFTRRTDASKIALVYLIARLKAGGYTLLDTQFVTDHLRNFGATEISRNDYRRRLDAALEVDAEFLRLPADTPAAEIARIAVSPI